MLKIDLKTVDKLYEISYEICAISYLQSIQQWSENEKVFNNRFQYIENYTRDYLYERQENAAKKLWDLISQDDFTINLK